MIGLFDRDVFLKLCCCDLWVEANASLGITQPYRLESTSSERSNGKVLSRMLRGQDISHALGLTIATAGSVPVLPDDLTKVIKASQYYHALADIEGIDTGEQILGAALMSTQEPTVLITGDKRFVQAFRGRFPDEWQQHGNAIISFERCLLAIEAAYGFDVLANRLVAASSCDQSLRLALGKTPNREALVEALRSFDPCR